MIIEFNLVDDSIELNLQLLDDNEEIIFNMTDYDDTELKREIADINSDIEDLQTNKANISDIPDVSNFITKTVDDLVNYYKKNETYNKTEVNNLIGQISSLQFQVVNELPQTGNSNYIYLVPSADPQTQNIKDEYIWVNNTWEQIGSTAIDLSDYITESDLSTALEEYGELLLQAFYTKEQVDNMFSSLSIPTSLSQLLEDSTHRLVTDTEKETWNNKQNAITSNNKLASDLVDDTNQTNLFVTTAEKTTWNSKSDFSGSYPDLTNNPLILRNDAEGSTVNINTLYTDGETRCYQFLNEVNLKIPQSGGNVNIVAAAGNTINVDGSGGQASFCLPGGNYYVYPDETPVTTNTTWSGSYCPDISEVEQMVATAGGYQNIQQSGTATGTINMLANQWFKKTRASGITRATIKFPDEIDDNYKAKFTCKTTSGFSAFTITSNTYDTYFYGDDCVDGVVTGVGGKTYEMEARNNGFDTILVKVFAI